MQANVFSMIFISYENALKYSFNNIPPSAYIKLCLLPYTGIIYVGHFFATPLLLARIG